MITRKAAKNDLKGIIDLFKKEYSKPPYNERWTDKDASEKIRKYYKNANIIVTVINGQIKGFIIFSEFLWFDGVRGMIDEVVVDAKEQGKGIGGNLIKSAERFFKNKNIKVICLMSVNTSKAFKIYKKYGYRNSSLVNMIKKSK